MIFTKSAIPSFYVDLKFREVKAEENSKQIVQNLFRQHLNLNTEPSNIPIARPLGVNLQPPLTNGTPSSSYVDVTLQSGKRFRNLGEPQALYVNASLIPFVIKYSAIFACSRRVFLRKRYPTRYKTANFLHMSFQWCRPLLKGPSMARPAISVCPQHSPGPGSLRYKNSPCFHQW